MLFSRFPKVPNEKQFNDILLKCQIENVFKEVMGNTMEGTENPRVRSSTLRLGTINFLIMIKGLAIFLAGPFFMDLGDCNGFCNSLEKFSLPLRRLLQVRVRHNVIAVEDRPRLVA